MSLEQKVQDRYSSQFLVNLTNPQDETATSIDSTRLANAAADVKGDFITYVNAEYDETESQHVATAIDGVILKLRIYSGQVYAEDVQDYWVKRLKSLARVTARNRPMPVTDGVVTPTPEQRGSETVRPEFDRSRFNHFVPGDPRGGNSLNDPDL